MPETLSILIILEKYPNLSETFIEREIQALKKLGYNIKIISLSAIAPCFSPIKSNSIELITKIFTGSFCDILRKAFYLPKLIRIASDYPKADIVYCHFASITSFLGEMIAGFWEVPYIVSVHANDIFVPSGFSIRTLHGAKRVITCSKAAYEESLKYVDKNSKVTLMHHGLDLINFPFTKYEKRRNAFLFAGRFVEKKGIKYIIKAFESFCDNKSGFQLFICGSGPHENEIKELINISRHADKIVLKSFMKNDELILLLKQVKALTVPSVVGSDGDRDGIPNIALEAMAVGTPVIASKGIGGLPEIVSDEITGITCKPGSPADIVDKLSGVADDRYNLEDMTRNARKLIEEEFDIQQNILILDRIFKEIAQ